MPKIFSSLFVKFLFGNVSVCLEMDNLDRFPLFLLTEVFSAQIICRSLIL